MRGADSGSPPPSPPTSSSSSTVEKKLLETSTKERLAQALAQVGALLPSLRGPESEALLATLSPFLESAQQNRRHQRDALEDGDRGDVDGEQAKKRSRAEFSSPAVVAVVNESKALTTEIRVLA